MTETLRTFIAIDVALPQELRALLKQFGGMGSAVKTVDADSTHVTLKFLGDTSSDLLPDIEKSLGMVAGEHNAFDVELTGVGAFPHWGRPQVVWVGLSPKEPLQKLAERLETELEPLGFAREQRTFHPHLTLARIKAKPRKELKELAEAHETTSFGSQTIDRVILYQSVLQKGGPIYTPLSTAHFPLG